MTPPPLKNEPKKKHKKTIPQKKQTQKNKTVTTATTK